MPFQNNFFIPLTAEQLSTLLLEQTPNSGHKDDLNGVILWLQEVLQKEFRGMQKNLVKAYSAIDPDRDTLRLAALEHTSTEHKFRDYLEQVLTQANFFQLTKKDLQAALKESSLFNIRLDIDFNDFEDIVLYCRGAKEKSETIKIWLGLREKNITFINYDRVVVFLRFKEANKLGANIELLGRSKKTMLKLYRNVPKADLEMLFPNTRIGMRTLDKLLIGVPAVVSGIIVISTKLGTTLVLLGGLLGFWLGLHQTPVELNTATLIALGAGLGTLIGYCWKQFSVFKTRKLKFAQALTQNLYFKSLDNNAGVFYRLLAEAEDEEFKEALLAWHFLRINPGLNAEELDRTIEQWLTQIDTSLSVDFDVTDALQKLERFGLASQQQKQWQAHLPKAL